MVSAPEAAGSLSPPSESDGVARRYAEAVRDSDWEAVVDRVLWMQERLEQVKQRDGSDAAGRQELLRRAADRSAEGNRLQLYEGVEDQYLFAPGVELSVLGGDGGEADLERPVARRTWIEVTYPARDRALLGEEKLPIHHLKAGVSVSSDGYVLKAALIGNVEIDVDSIDYRWKE